jgi:hypothetical protein
VPAKEPSSKFFFSLHYDVMGMWNLWFKETELCFSFTFRIGLLNMNKMDLFSLAMK